MIDDPDQVEHLIGGLRERMPLLATVTPALAAVIRRRSPAIDAPRQCRVMWVDYAGDEAGIVCQLDLGGETGQEVFFVSITHLAFGRLAPLSREIAAYQKHRIKRLRRLGGPAGPLRDHP